MVAGTRAGEINHTNTGNTIQNQSRVNTWAVINMSSVHENIRDCFSFDLQLGGNTESKVKFYLSTLSYSICQIRSILKKIH